MNKPDKKENSRRASLEIDMDSQLKSQTKKAQNFHILKE